MVQNTFSLIIGVLQNPITFNVVTVGMFGNDKLTL